MSAGVLVLHPWWGLNQDVLASAERLRSQGYHVVTPDLYRGRVATTIDAATALRDEVDRAQSRTMSVIEEGLSKLTAQADSVAVLAWSMGVWYGWQLAQARADVIRGLVVYYGLGDADAAGSLPPVLGHFAEQDEFESLDDIRRTQQSLLDKGRDAEFHIYPATKHWFDEPSRPEFDRDASALAFERTLAFLARHLRR